MSASWQLQALIKKNLILMKRSWFATLCEIFFPILLMILLVLFRKLIEIVDYNDPIVDIDYLRTNSSLLISPSELFLNNSKLNTNSKWDGMTFHNPL